MFANYGRYYARVPSDLAARALSSDALDHGRLLRSEPDAAGARRHRHDQCHHRRRRRRRISRCSARAADDIDPNAKLSYYNEWVVGRSTALARGLDVGVRYVHRDIGRVLEDVQPYPIVAISLGLPGAATANYLLTNPGPGTPVDPGSPGATVSFESPIHNYNAVEFTANKRLANKWSLISLVPVVAADAAISKASSATTTASRIPGISSLYDYPTNDPTYTSIGGPQFGYTGDIRFLGSAGNGPLPLDRTARREVVWQLRRSTWA